MLCLQSKHNLTQQKARFLIELFDAAVQAKTDSTGMHIGQLLASMSAAREQWLLRHQLSTRKRQMGSMESATECPVCHV